MGAFGLTDGYSGPITSHVQVLHPSTELCDSNELKVIQTLVSDIQYLF